MSKSEPKAYVISVDMGYGHLRAAYPLKELAYQKKIINANNYVGIPNSDRKIWLQSRQAYEFISRFKKVPILGETAFDLFDKFQSIPEFYPKRDLSEPSFQLKSTISLIKKNKWGKHLIDKLAKKPLPIVSSFYIPAFMAEIFRYPGEIYCLGTDTDLSRAWAPINPISSKIKYFAPSHRAAERLQLYGVRQENIFVTGFPLPRELVDGGNQKHLKKHLGKRLFNLDPKKRYLNSYHETIDRYLGPQNFPKEQDHPLTIMFAVGGAGAQRELGIDIVNTLKNRIIKNQLRIILVAGINREVNQYFKKEIIKLGLGSFLGKSIKIIFTQNKDDYFVEFNCAMRTTDILWTKPSELSFYTALGLPIIMSPTVGSQEEFNKHWLITIGSGIVQEDVKYADQWLYDWLDSGWLAEAAMQGFIEASNDGLDNIRKILFHKPEELINIKEVLQY